MSTSPICPGCGEYDYECRCKPTARVKAIKEIQRLCEEAIDHNTSWVMFCNLVRDRLEIETILMPYKETK